MNITILLYLLLLSCNTTNMEQPVNLPINTMIESPATSKVNSLESRILPPKGYQRTPADTNSFAHYLRQLPLKSAGSAVLLYNGQEKSYQDSHVAVIDMEIGNKNLQQCADACIRLWAEYLWKQKRYDEIQFPLTNGFNMEYTKWQEGNRLKVDGNKTWWEKSATPSRDYKSFRAYLDRVFTFAGTLSVERQIKPVPLKDLQPGDMFVSGGSPGHAVMVADVAVNQKGEKVFLLLQSFMPAQDIHIVKNPNNPELSPWYTTEIVGSFRTQEWLFERYTLGRF